MEFIIFILLIGVFIYVSRLSGRITELERKLGQRAAQPDANQTNQQSAAVPVSGYIDPYASPQPNASFAPADTRDTYEPPGPNPFVEWVKQDFLVKLGALLLLIALGWFVSYAFANNWIGPAGRIVIGLLIGVVFMAVGTVRMAAARHQGGIFTVLGAATVILTMFAARELYDFFTPTSALLVMFLAIAFVTYVSLLYRSERLAVAGLVLAMISPLLTAAGTPETLNLFLYLTVIVVGSIWVVFITGWRFITPVALASVFFWSLPFMDSYGRAEDVALTFGFIFTALFFVTNIVSTVRRHDPKYVPAQLTTAALTVVFIASWIVVGISENLQSLLFTAWAVVFALGAYFVFAHTNNKHIFYLYGSASIALIGAATAAELSGPVLTVAFTLEVALLVSVAVFLRAPRDIVRNCSLLFGIPILMSLESLDSSAWREGILHTDGFVLALMTIVSLRVAAFLGSRARRFEDESLKTIAAVFYSVGAFYAVALIWLATHAVLADSVATTTSLIIYTIFGLLLFIQGKQLQSNLMRTIGSVLIGMVVLRLLLIDVWNMPISGRIITFFVIGILLISTAFIRKQQSNHD